ncbi:family 16 glycosylhydrolase [Flammeovirga agarivorans]|uniref:Family 16 glycosylhydrolase n=1 Tax=Flammeovirga agarivorans TaxID=2726742 RepID=A0A7X8XYZ8_9BACT|nr:family 16 glycosylhydrolase [Flammeovirga agarivorans]NLR94697.1 family 16 glycosylhydrolase [Flammeovirga agarivorans]
MKNQIILLFTLLLLNVILPVFSQINPVSDPENTQKWILNKWISDEFNGTELNKTKWWILGENNDYRSKWKGRAPGQFASHNVKVSDGQLKLTSQWDPTFNFANETNDGCYYGGTKTAADLSKPITQACIMSETFFKYGYMEIKCKIADAPVTSAFWTTGYHSEIDMVENYGKRPIGNPEETPEELEYKYRTNLISWDPDRAEDHEEWKIENVMNSRLADDFHIYGFEWDKNYMKIYFDGHLIKTATKEELLKKDQWKYDYPQEMWLDSEVFEWYGLPNQEDLSSPAEFIIDYVRVWQKEEPQSFFDALSFEGPFYFSGRSVNWWSSQASNWRMKDDKARTGDFSLRYQGNAPFTGNYSTFSPYGSLDLPEGANTLSFYIWIDESTEINTIDFVLSKPYKEINVDLSSIKKGQWVEVNTSFERNDKSDTNIINGDRIQIKIQAESIESTEALFFFDDISFENSNESDVSPEYPFPDDEYTEQEYPKDEEEKPTHSDQPLKIDWGMYPNPSSSIINVYSNSNGSLKIINAVGVELMDIAKQKEEISIALDDLRHGLYYVVFESKGLLDTKKLVIE